MKEEIILLLIWVSLSVLWVTITVILIRRSSKRSKPSCNRCRHQHSTSCPNSFYCYSREDKPYFEERLKDTPYDAT